MEKMAKLAKCSGNTKPRVTPSKYWCFTDYSMEMAKWQTIFSMEKIKYIIGREICPTTSREHLQGYIECPGLIRPLEKFKNMPGVHWEKRIGTREQNIEYCAKEGNYETNFEDIIIKEEVGQIMNEELVLTDWMQELIDYIKGPRDYRKIYWIWDLEGGKGKTRFCKYLLKRFKDCVYFTGGRTMDITSQLLECEYDPKLCLFDLPRSNEGHIAYNALEQIKNGLINSSKYKGGFKMFDSPHVIVFANFKPELSELSSDRWIIKQI